MLDVLAAGFFLISGVVTASALVVGLRALATTTRRLLLRRCNRRMVRKQRSARTTWPGIGPHERAKPQTAVGVVVRSPVTPAVSNERVRIHL
jgi:hypothetical protein